MSVVAERLQQLFRARRALGLGPEWFVLAGALSWFSWPTLLELHPRWVDYGYQHGYLVLALTAWLVAREIRRSPLAPSAPSVLGLACLSAAVLGVLVGRAATTSSIAFLFLPLVWPVAVWACTGSTNARRLAVPLLYFYFAVPLWDAFNTPLQRLTVIVVSAWLRAAAIPAYIDGNLIHLPNGTFEIAGGCSGLHFLVAGLALAALAGLLHHERWRERALLVAAALVVSLVANWLRVFTVVVAGYLTDMQHYLVAKNHYYFGWALFLVCWVPVIMLDRRLQRSARPSATSSRPTTQTGRAVSGVKVDPTSTRRATFALRAIATVAVIVLGAGIWISRALEAPLVVGRPATTGVPVVAGWRELGEWSDAHRPVFVGATTEISGRYVRDGLEVAAFIARYAAQGQGHEVVYYANRPEGEGAEIVSRAKVDVPGRDAPFAELEVADRGGARSLVWFQLRVAGRPVIGEIQAKLLQATGVLRGRRDAEALVLSASCAEDCSRARAALDEFARSAADLLYGSVAPRARETTNGGL